MKLPRLVSLLFFLELSASALLAQGSHPVPRGIREAEQAEAQTQKDIPPPLARRTNIDLAKLSQEANELARLSQTIPLDVASVRSGILPKGFIQKLKQIEKLSKHLRSELNP